MVIKDLIGKNWFEMNYVEPMLGGRYQTVKCGVKILNENEAEIFFAHDGKPIHYRSVITFFSIQDLKSQLDIAFSKKVPLSIVTKLYNSKGKG